MNLKREQKEIVAKNQQGIRCLEGDTFRQVLVDDLETDAVRVLLNTKKDPGPHALV